MSNNLEGYTVYLAGPIDFVDDDGIGWRKEFREKTNHLGFRVLDPTNKPLNMSSEIGEEKTYINQLKENKEWSKITEKVKQIRRSDLRMVDHSNFVVVYVDTDVHMMGSYDEILTAEDQQKPIFAIIKGGKKKASSWLFAVVNYWEMFDTVDELVDHLNKLNNKENFQDKRLVRI